jgi:hypothetical protein
MEREELLLRNRECPNFTVAKPCGEQLDKYGECIDLTGKISTPSLLRNLFLTPDS